MNPGILLIIVFSCTVLTVCGIAFFIYQLIFAEQKTVERRFDSLGSAINKTNFGQMALSELQRKTDQNREFFSRFPDMMNISLLLEQAGVQTDAVQWLFKIALIACLPSILLGTLTTNWIWAGMLLIILLVVPYFSLVWKRKSRLSQFEAQLSQALDIISRSLRAGHPLSVGLQMVSTELPEPISSEFSRIFYEEQMGIPLDESLRALTKRVPIIDLNFFVVTILIHRQIGGDLAEIIDGLSKIVRERFRILGQVRTLTAEGRLSGWVLILLPIAMFCLIMFMNPQYEMLLFKTEMGHKLLIGGGVMMLLGVLLIRKIVNIKV